MGEGQANIFVIYYHQYLFRSTFFYTFWVWVINIESAALSDVKLQLDDTEKRYHKQKGQNTLKWQFKSAS